jgi:CubicO group peptidase (beta-lactamase class C family)
MQEEALEVALKIKSSKLDEAVWKAFFYNDLPGMAIGIGSGSGGLQYVKTCGVKNLETQETLVPADIFHMASLAKLFTGTGIMLLWECGSIDLDAPVRQYLNWFRMKDEAAEKITIKQLLTHTSGMPDVRDYHWDRPKVREDALRDYIGSEELTGASLLWEPDLKRFSYSNMGYDLLGLIIAEVSGVSFEEFIRQNIFRVIGMEDSTFLTFERDMSKICAPHKKNQAKEIEVAEHYPYNREHAPSSTLTSNLGDIEKWAMAHLKQSILKPETYRTLWDEFTVVPNNGEKICLSWFVREQNGCKLYGHEGADDGFRSSFWICPDLDLFIIICANISNAPLKKISKQIFEIVTKTL